MNEQTPSANKPHLMWISTNTLVTTLDSATWLETTRELRRLGWQVTLVGSGPDGPQSVRGVEIFNIARPNIYLLRQAFFHLKFLWLLLKNWSSVDVVLFHQMSAPWILPLRFWRLGIGKGPQFVMDIRSVHMEPRDKETRKARLRRAFHRLINQMANRWADGQTAITRRMAESVQIPSRRLWGIWPSGVKPDQFISAQTARRWPQEGEPIELVYIGSLHYERNLMNLCRAVEQANSHGLAFKFVLVGEGTERAELEAYAAQTEGRIRVLPPVPHEQIGEILGQAHIGTLPFPDEEKFRVSSPIKLFEYLAAGLPILATRIVCHTDVIGKGPYVFWAESADMEGLLAALYSIGQNRASLVHKGYQAASAVHSWTWHEAAKKLKASLEYGLKMPSDPNIDFLKRSI